ncbi:DUF3017 domain-containing protein [Propionicicella superfundia]|uniref:DUF3017 domain-containing protein n=1 Tax=Propionicicella superfundia TaxID=348582 RepID=UPI0004039B7F|nr:DUF3017 domain-containing protein [Propionicicella superfundia]
MHKVLDEWPLLIVLGGVVVGLGITMTGHWRIGSTAIGLSVTLGGVLRLILPRPVAKLLGVRSRLTDVLCYLVAGLGILALTWVVPPQR